MPSSLRWSSMLCGVACALVACSKPADPAPPPPAAGRAAEAAAEHDLTGIAWRHASNDAEVDAAFATAAAEAKPVFVYWGAKWCPPCNQVKATLFNRQDFIERSRAFVPVYIDGDSPGAQRLGSRFKVGGYPTMVLFSPRGVELTRLPGEVEAERYTQVLTLAMNAQRPVREVLAQALAGGAGLTPNDWRLLAFYSWETDQQQLVAQDGVAALLTRLAAGCPADQPEAATRLHLKALAAVGEKARARPDLAARTLLLRVASDAPAARRYMDVFTNGAADIARATAAAGTPERAEVVAALDGALQRFAADATLSRADRMAALLARVDLATIDAPKPAAGTAARTTPQPALPAALVAEIRTQTARADREITDGYERQAVITAAADLLEQAGLDGESDALLKANLAKSHSPYYLMVELAANARARGDKQGALRWYEEAFDKSEGPATRLQWGQRYVTALVDLGPTEEARIEAAARRLFTEAAAQPDAFYERSGRSLQRVGAKLQAWNSGGAHAAAIGRLQRQLDGVCLALPEGDAMRTNCGALLKPAAAAVTKRAA